MSHTTKHATGTGVNGHPAHAPVHHVTNEGGLYNGVPAPTHTSGGTGMTTTAEPGSNHTAFYGNAAPGPGSTVQQPITAAQGTRQATEGLGALPTTTDHYPGGVAHGANPTTATRVNNPLHPNTGAVVHPTEPALHGNGCPMPPHTAQQPGACAQQAMAGSAIPALNPELIGKSHTDKHGNVITPIGGAVATDAHGHPIHTATDAHGHAIHPAGVPAYQGQTAKTASHAQQEAYHENRAAAAGATADNTKKGTTEHKDAKAAEHIEKAHQATHKKEKNKSIVKDPTEHVGERVKAAIKVPGDAVKESAHHLAEKVHGNSKP